MTATYLAGARVTSTEQTFGFTLTPEPWTKLAACAEVPGDLFFTDDAGERVPEQVKDLCRNCPSRVACGEYALRNRIDDGMWGGMTPRERNEIRRAANR